MSTVLRGQRWTRALAALAAAGGEDPYAWMERETRLLKSDAHSRVGLLHLDGALCHLKCYRPKGPIQSLQFRLGRGRGPVAYDNALRLLHAGLDVPEPRACLRTGGSILLLTEGLADGVDLKRLLTREPLTDNRGHVLARAGATLAAWHGAGFSHGDCKWSNFLLSGNRLVLVDLEAVSRSESGGEGAARDLARFTVNAEDMALAKTDYSEFLVAYCRALQLEPDAVLQRIRPRVEALRRRHLKKYGRRGHRLL